MEIGDGRKRQFVVDAGIVDPERCRKEAVADDFVGDALSEWNERYGEPGKARAPKANRHKTSPQVWCRESIWTANSRQVHVNRGGARAWACEPVREPNRSGVRSRQSTRSGCR